MTNLMRILNETRDVQQSNIRFRHDDDCPALRTHNLAECWCDGVIERINIPARKDRR